MNVEQILVVDDDKLNVELLSALLEKKVSRVECAYNGRQAWQAFQRDPADVVLTDVRMSRMDGLELLKRIKAESPETAVILMTSYGAVDSAVEAMRLGAYDYVAKPFREEEVDDLLARLQREGLPADQDDHCDEEGNAATCRLITADERMQAICESTRRAATTKASVLIQGESGTGKELIARYVHELSPRREKAFVRINCAALPETLLESELFGHEKGAFTGAVERRAGRFELADGGTLLLDEISEISPALQAKLLRVLEEEEFERVGGSTTIRVDVRVVATTNRDLQQAIEDGAFREDLYYRLNVIPVALPPLRERAGDVPYLVGHFLKEYAEQNRRHPPRVTEEAMRLLERYPWPGNVRELRNLMQRMVVLNGGDVLDMQDLPPEIRGEAPQRRAHVISVGHTIEEAERWLIMRTLQHTRGNRTEAANLLGVTTRTLRNKLSRYRAENAGEETSASDAEDSSGSGRAETHSAHGGAEIWNGTAFAETALPA